MAVEVVDQPEASDWAAGIACDLCHTRFTFSGEDVWRTDNQSVARVTCPGWGCLASHWVKERDVPSWAWLRFKRYETSSWD